jgi:tetratricopeptide (TPR) repeat protein
MRFLMPFVAFSLAVFLNLNPLSGAQREQAQREQSLSGRLIFENGDFTCDRCVVTLLANGVRPAGTTITDLSGHFTFPNVPRGNYTIRVEIDGFEDVNQAIEAAGSESNVLVSVVRKRRTDAGPAQIVNVNELTERYSKKAVSYFEKGTSALEQKKYDEAIKNLRQAVELAPTFYQAHNELGRAYRESGRNDDAEKEFITAHELNSTGIAPLLNLTTLYLEENEPDRAVKTGEEAVKINSHSAPAFFNLGVALYKTSKLDRAEAALKRALELAPKMPSVRLMLANVYLKLHRYDSTLDQLNSYIAENPHGQQLEAVQRMRDELMKAGEASRP